MKPMQLLKKDHTGVKRIFTEFDRTTARAVKKRRDLLERIGLELEVHARIEEELFYPAVAELEGGRRLVDDARQEHQAMRELLDELRHLDPADTAIKERAKELRDTVADHATEEEHEMFPLAERLGAERLISLAEELEARKRELMEELGPVKGRRAA